jgi:hypothetical protein
VAVGHKKSLRVSPGQDWTAQVRSGLLLGARLAAAVEECGRVPVMDIPGAVLVVMLLVVVVVMRIVMVVATPTRRRRPPATH